MPIVNISSQHVTRATTLLGMRVLFDTPDEQWLFSREEVESFPSVQQYAPFAYELAYRVQAVTELFDIGNFHRLNWK